MSFNDDLAMARQSASQADIAQLITHASGTNARWRFGYAYLSRDELYRYELGRSWNEYGKTCCFIMLNPSKADAMKDDSTIIRCLGFAKNWGYGKLRVFNLFNYRSTQPADMKAASDPVGPLGDDYLRQVADCDLVVVAWGNHGTYKDRDKQVLNILSELSITPHCLRVSGATRMPHHPLRLPAHLQPVKYDGR